MENIDQHLILQTQIQYKTFKSTPKFEKCFADVKHIKHLKALTKLTLSDHKLMIEARDLKYHEMNEYVM